VVCTTCALSAELDVIKVRRLFSIKSNGRGVPQNNAEALKWLRLAAAQGDAEAQNNLGSMYGSGRGVPQDYAEALKWNHRVFPVGALDIPLCIDHVTPLALTTLQVMAERRRPCSSVVGTSDGVVR
jgi:hypothetical protein